MIATRPALAAAFLATLASAGVASADGAPGACDCAVTAPAPAPTAAALPRWGLGLHLASLNVADDAAMNPDGTGYGGGGLQVRYRLNAHWQLELTAAHLQEQNVDETTARQLDAVALAVLYHLRPHARWDLYLLAGVGATSDGDPDATDEARQASQISDVQLGGGVERRFGRIGVSAELRLLAREPAPTAQAGLMTDRASGDAPRRDGGQLTLGGTYYF